ncbi:MAG: hypothetical protein H6772_02450 [Pseudomonadales bacterium]|nr:hypothetical protein [Pseudomonadales bacterium]
MKKNKVEIETNIIKSHQKNSIQNHHLKAKSKLRHKKFVNSLQIFPIKIKLFINKVKKFSKFILSKFIKIKFFFNRISDFFKDPKVSLIIKITIISFFLGVNIVLGKYFIENNTFHIPKELLNFLTQTGLIEKPKVGYLAEEIQKEVKTDLDPQVIFQKLNSERISLEVGELEYSDQLASAAAILIAEAEKYDYDLEKKDFLEELKNALKTVGYNYLHVSHNMVIGPQTEQAIVDAWFSDAQQIEALKDDDFEDVGFATKIVEIKDLGTVGVVVQVLGKPMKQVNVVPQQVAIKGPVYPDISDEEVFNALNDYRASHQIFPLNFNKNLCNYASRRVNDLIEFGGLDDHAGFIEDFADLENLPDEIKYYPGKNIGENLAFQNCKNMQTGDSFIAQTGTSIIEWCFDSSTIGHREAQLSREFKNACVRHGENMYVIIFGD